MPCDILYFFLHWQCCRLAADSFVELWLIPGSVVYLVYDEPGWRLQRWTRLTAPTSLASSQQIKRRLWKRRLNLNVRSLAWCSSSSSCCCWDWLESPPPAGWPTCRRKPCVCPSTSPWTTACPGPKSRRLSSGSWCKICRLPQRSFLNLHKRLRTKPSSATHRVPELQDFFSPRGFFFFFFFILWNYEYH